MRDILVNTDTFKDYETLAQVFEDVLIQASDDWLRLTLDLNDNHEPIVYMIVRYDGGKLRKVT